MKNRVLYIISTSLVIAMLCALPSLAYLERTTGTVGGYSTVGMIWGSDSVGYYSNTYVSSSARGSIAYIYAKIWLRTTNGTPQTATNYSTNANTNDLDSLPGVFSNGLNISARSWNYIKLLNGSTWGNKNEDTTYFLDYTIAYYFPD